MFSRLDLGAVKVNSLGNATVAVPQEGVEFTSPPPSPTAQVIPLRRAEKDETETALEHKNKGATVCELELRTLQRERQHRSDTARGAKRRSQGLKWYLRFALENELGDLGRVGSEVRKAA